MLQLRNPKCWQHPAPATPREKPLQKKIAIHFQIGSCSSSCVHTTTPTPHADWQEFKALADAVSAIEARLLCCRQALEDKMTALQCEILCNLQMCAIPPPLPATLPLPHLATSTPGPRPTESTSKNIKHLPRLPQVFSSWDNAVGTSIQEG